MEDRGDLRWEYDPPRAHPILYAGALVFGVVFLSGSAENLLREARPEIFAVYALPLLLDLAVLAALLPSPVRIHANGVAPSRPLVLRWWRPFLPWLDVAACYPASYDVTGAFVSPFASSDGKVTQTGIALEMKDGHVETLRFTPTRFSLTSRRSLGFRAAWDVVEDAFRRQGRPLVPDAPRYTPEQKEAMVAEARKPFLPFFAIVFLFASAAPVAWALIRFAHLPPGPAVLVGLLAPLGTSLRSWTASRKRNRILNALSKSAESERERDAVHGNRGDGTAVPSSSAASAVSVERSGGEA